MKQHIKRSIEKLTPTEQQSKRMWNRWEWKYFQRLHSHIFAYTMSQVDKHACMQFILMEEKDEFTRAF